MPYVEQVGWKARDTAEQAAESMVDQALNIRALVLSHFQVGLQVGWTADEVADYLNLSVLTVRPRVSELARLGKLVDTGLRRPNASGRNAIVWRLA